jgi:hypothetical protein
MNNLEDSTFGFIYELFEIFLYGITAATGVICVNPPTKTAGINLQKIIGCSIGFIGACISWLQLLKYIGTLSKLLNFLLTWLSIFYLMRMYCDGLDRRRLGRIENGNIIIV